MATKTRTLGATVERIEQRNRAAGDKTAAALLALSRTIRTTQPDLFAEVSGLLHGALNDATMIAYDTDDLTRRLTITETGGQP